MGERVEGQWLISDRTGRTLAHVPCQTREEALAEVGIVSRTRGP
jgi:hypothetical protein